MLLIWVVLGFCVLIRSFPAFADDLESVPAQPARVAYGVSLYEEFCTDCHQSFGKTTKPKRSVRRLGSSVEYFPVMRELEFLSEGQLDAIAAALSTVPFKTASLLK